MTRIGNAFRIGLACVALFALTFPGSAQAQNYAKAGPYAGLGFAIGFDNFDDLGLLDNDPAYGFNAWGGYRLSPHFAGELMIEYLNGFNVDDVILGTPVDASFQALNFTGNVKGYLLTGRWQPFALIGIGMLWQEAQNNFTGQSFGLTAFSARFGGGLDFYLTEALALDINAAYNLPTGDLDGGDYVSLVIGAQYRF